MAALSEIRQSVIRGQETNAAALTVAALKAKIPANEIMHEGLIAAMKTVGQKFENGEFFFPELLLAGNAMKAALEELRPALIKEDVSAAGKYAIGTVQGDIHDIGKNIVVMMLQSHGWEVTDLGVDLPPERFCAAVKEGDFQILGMSSLLTLTMPNLAKTIEALQAAGLREKVKIMVGGAPVTQAYADRIGADAYARDAVEAVAKAELLLNNS